jgi:hypothetical protein
MDFNGVVKVKMEKLTGFMHPRKEQHRCDPHPPGQERQDLNVDLTEHKRKAQLSTINTNTTGCSPHPPMPWQTDITFKCRTYLAVRKQVTRVGGVARRDDD